MGCPFDGEKCKSLEKYECVDGLKIGVDCWNSFYNKSNKN
jgi:hypothetical protein